MLLVSDVHESVFDAEQAVILRKLFVNERKMRVASWLKWLGLVALILVLAATVRYLQPPVPTFSVWDFQDPELVLGQLQIAAGHYALQGVQFCLLGLLLPLTFRRRNAVEQLGGSHAAHVARGRFRRACRFLARIVAQALVAIGAFFAGAAVAAAVSMLLVNAVGTAIALDVGLALLGISAGIWIGSWLSRGWTGAGHLLIQAVALVSFLAVSGLWLRAQVLQAQPLDFEPLKVTSADKRELVDLIRQQKEIQDGHEVFHLTTDQIDKLLAWSTAFVSAESKAKVELTDSGQRLWGSLTLPARVAVSRPYLNIMAQGRCEIALEKLELDLQSAQIGSLTIPSVVTQLVGGYLASWVNDDPLNRELLVGVSAVVTHKDGADLYVTLDGLRHRRLARLIREVGDHPDTTDAVSKQLAELAGIVKAAKRKDPLFAAVVRRAFETASVRSQSGDPARENRAAILALGIALGTIRLEPFVGNLPSDKWRGYVAVIPLHSKLRDRADWSQHFWVSAAVTLLATNRVSDALGLLKEELDAGQGGSGFSFGDLAADRAGTAFAQAATRDADSARAIQRWILADDTDLNELMPAAADLPEGMSDAEMRDHFDAVNGVRYQQMIDEIEKRVRELPWGSVR